MLKSLLAWRWSGLASLSRFRKREDGAAAVEFAMVVLPFFGLIFAVLELAIFFFASRYLEEGLFNARRKVLTQQLAQETICTAFKSAVDNELSKWFSPSKVKVNVRTGSSFSAIGPAQNMSDSVCSFGASGQATVVEATYDYPLQAFRFVGGYTTFGNSVTLSAKTAFRVE